MKRLLLAFAVVVAGCDDRIPGLCQVASDCPGTGKECVDGLCRQRQDAGEAPDSGESDGGGGAPDSGEPDGGGGDAPDSGGLDGGGRNDGGADAGSPAPGGKWEAATSGSAYGDKAMANSRYKVVGSLGEPGGEGGSVEMKNSSHRCIGGFNAALRSK